MTDTYHQPDFKDFTPCGIEIVKDSSLRIEASRRLKGTAGKNFLDGISLEKVALDDEAWFLSAYQGNSATMPSAAQPPAPPPLLRSEGQNQQKSQFLSTIPE